MTPLKGVTYRVTTTSRGKKVRLAIKTKGGEVVEAKSLSSGAVHTPAEFAADRKRAAQKRRTKR
jgi:hypothetical protein